MRVFSPTAFNQLTKRSFATTVLETSATAFKGMVVIHTDHAVAAAGAVDLVSNGRLRWFATRSLSIVLGLVALTSWFIIVRSLFKLTSLAFLVLALLSCHYIFIVCASAGRMDMMSAALGFAGFATYLRLRESSLAWAIFLVRL